MADIPRQRTRDHADPIAGALLRALLVVVGVLLLAWWASMVSLALLLAFAGVVIAIAVNGPVTWLELRGVHRTLGTFAVVGAIGIVGSLAFLFVGARVVDQVALLADEMPGYLRVLEQQSDDVFGSGSRLDEAFEPTDPDSSAQAVLPAVEEIATSVGRYSLDALGVIVLSVAWLTIVVYLVLEPRSMLRGMLRLAPVGERVAVARTFERFSEMVVGWLWANLFVGITQGVLIAVFLSALDIRGAIIWGVVAVFATFIPKIGIFVMAAPPLIIALIADPLDALWIVLFYTVLNSVMSDIVLPRLQGHAMRVHPAYLVVFVLAFATAFGLLGALVATPFAGLVHAVWSEFVLSRRPPVDDLDGHVERMLTATVEAPEPPSAVP